MTQYLFPEASQSAPLPLGARLQCQISEFPINQVLYKTAYIAIV